jgi:hypothetical protein
MSSGIPTGVRADYLMQCISVAHYLAANHPTDCPKTLPEFTTDMLIGQCVDTFGIPSCEEYDRQDNITSLPAMACHSTRLG